MTAKALAKTIKNTRQRLRLTQDQLAIKLGISAQLISAFESGRIRPQRKYLQKLAELANVPIAIFTGDRVEEALSRLKAMQQEIQQIHDLLVEAAGSDED